MYKVYKSIEKFTYHEIKLEAIQSNAPSEGKPQHLVPSWLQRSKQRSTAPATLLIQTAQKLQEKFGMETQGLGRCYSICLCFPPLWSSTVQSAKRTGWSYSAPEIQGVQLKARVSPDSTTELPRRNWDLPQEFSNTRG